MQAFENGNWYDIQFEYSPKKIEAIKRIPGRWYSGADKVWKVPRSEKYAVENLLKIFGKKNTIADEPMILGEIPPMPELPEEYEAILAANLLRQPYHYQKQGIAFNLLHKRVINGDDMGGGKTTTTIATIVAAGLHKKCGLIVTKGAVKYTWQKEFKVVAGINAAILKDAIKNTWPSFHFVAGTNVFITNYESLEKYFVQKINKKEGKATTIDDIVWKTTSNGTPMIDMFAYVVLDESHEIRNEDTTKSVIAVGLGQGKEYRFCLSGTAMVNKTFDLYTQLNFLGRTKNTKESRRHFIDRYCGGGSGKGSTNSQELHYKLRLNCYFRRNKSEFGLDLPELTLQMVYSEISNRKEYDMALRDLSGYLLNFKGKTQGQVDKSMNAKAMVLIGVQMDIAARGKMREAIEEIDGCLNAGRKIVVFLNQKGIKEQLTKHYPNGLVISGEENAEQKNKAETAFNTSPEPIPIFVSIKAGGVGINLQHDCTDMLFIELPWHPALYYQAIARVHRNGVKNATVAKNLIGKDTIDEKIWEIIESKKESADTILGNEDNTVIEVISKITQDIFSKK
jgi:SWI/SNF-related matrix-associated actin-dependent regulator 1 of chromatin subfamily A